MISRELGDRRGVAKLLSRLADLRFAAGAGTEARELLRQARTILTELDDPEADDLVGNLADANAPTVPTPARR